MSVASFIQLTVLSAIWGSSFIFMKIAVPYFGPVWMIEARLALAAVFLFVVALFIKKRLNVAGQWKHYLMLGTFNTALPFLLLAYSAQTLTASLMAILNATAPIWGAIIGAIWKKNRISGEIVIGSILGIVGVYILVGFESGPMATGATLAIIAALVAPLSYSFASAYAQSAVTGAPYSNAHGNMLAAALVVIPLLPFFPAYETPTTGAILSVITLGILCSGIAYIMYFRLIVEIGAVSALTVAYLIPVFGILWGTIFLGDVIGWSTVAGTVVILLGTSIVTGFSIRSLFGNVITENR